MRVNSLSRSKCRFIFLSFSQWLSFRMVFVFLSFYDVFSHDLILLPPLYLFHADYPLTFGVLFSLLALFKSLRFPVAMIFCLLSFSVCRLILVFSSFSLFYVFIGLLRCFMLNFLVFFAIELDVAVKFMPGIFVVVSCTNVFSTV